MVIVIKKSDSKREIKRKLKNDNQSGKKKLFDAKKFNGVIKLKENPVLIQKKLRNE